MPLAGDPQYQASAAAFYVTIAVTLAVTIVMSRDPFNRLRPTRSAAQGSVDPPLRDLRADIEA